MRRTATSMMILLAALAVVMVGWATPASADIYDQMYGAPQAADLPESFTAEANYMSLAGFHRYRTYELTGIWMTRAEAVAAVEAQLGTAAR